jgi:hypothetical protein
LINIYYKILELEEGASLSEIKKAYRRLAKMYHPDKNHSKDASDFFIIVNEAYEILLKWHSEKTKIETNKSNSEPFNKEQWIKNERIKARKRATENAKKRFEEFQKSKIYRTAMAFSTLTDFVFMFISIVIIVSPIIYTYQHGLDPKRIEMEITAIIAAIILGFTMFFILIKQQITNLLNRKLTD